MNNGERNTGGAERGVESTSEAAAERAAELLKSSERSGEKSPENAENRVAAERKEVEAAFSKEQSASEKKQGNMDGDSPAPGRKAVDSNERKTSYKKTMKRVQTEMTPSQRAFSQVIHNPVVDKASNVIGGTVARPNAILAGSFFAFIAVTAVYVVAKNYGYRLSGFESLGAFIIGWFFGLLYDYMKVMITGKR